ncbi:MAG: hypothetical protein Q7J35_10680 [Candidatus Methanoperedens sp.]|nr:hypothetical protein [Candidatus Methanoperedens sp.]
MDIKVKAIEITGTIDEKEWLDAVTSNPAFDFLKEPEEDIYTSEDGRPFQDR